MTFRLLRLSVPFVWFGAVCAISFMEAPLKFQAPNITTELGLGIGRIVFQVLNKIEIFFALVLLVSILVDKPRRSLPTVLSGVVFAILLLQTAWLLPTLDTRVTALLAGSPQPPSNLHLVYIVAETFKVVGLLLIGTVGLAGALRDCRESVNV